MTDLNIATNATAAAQTSELQAMASLYLGADHPLTPAIRAAALAGEERRLRALLDAVPPLRAQHLRAVLAPDRV
jgi:hypothetical protein